MRANVQLSAFAVCLALTPGTLVEAQATRYSLTVKHVGAGTGTTRANVGQLSCPGMCSDTYGDNTNVVLTAAPSTGSVFGGFGCSGLSITCTVNIKAATLVTANYNVPRRR